jgi:hypothetical protein
MKNDPRNNGDIRMASAEGNGVIGLKTSADTQRLAFKFVFFAGCLTQAELPLQLHPG